jgi:membrane fusion protein (multidrug efflux system)
MPSNFHQVTASIRSDHWGKSATVLIAAVVLIGSWGMWAHLARITQYEVSDSARLEIQSAPAAIQAGFNGRVSAIYMKLGQSVKAGDVLIAADTHSEQLALAEQIAKQAALGPQIAALDAQIKSEAAGSGDEHSVLGVSKATTLAQVRQAEAQYALAEKDRERYSELRKEGIVSEADAERVTADAESKRAALDALRQSLSRLAPEQQVRERTRQTRIDELLGDKAELTGELQTADAERQRLAYEIDRKVVRAPISGRLAECLTLAPGAHLTEGDKLGVILPSDQVHIVAEFDPASAFGKLRPGQAATLRLQGFPWAQFGVVPARVSNVASEIRDGKVRVELALAGRIESGVPLQHGLPGTIEIETERISPLALLLRTAGDLAGKH